MEGFGGGVVVEDGHGPVVDLVDGVLEVFVCEVFEVGSFRPVAADHAVGSLVGAAFPGVVRRREVRHCAESSFQFGPLGVF